MLHHTSCPKTRQVFTNMCEFIITHSINRRADEVTLPILLPCCTVLRRSNTLSLAEAAAACGIPGHHLASYPVAAR